MNTLTNLHTNWLRLLGLGFAFLSAGAAQAQTTASNPITWIGGTSTNYTLPQNWNLGRVPNQTDFVLIPATGTPVALPTTPTTFTPVVRQPELTPGLGIGAAGTLTIGANASLTLNAQSELDLFGDLSLASNAAILGSAGLLSIRSITPVGGTTPTLTNHTISSSGGTVNPILISDLETLTNAPTVLTNVPVRLIRSLTLNANLTTAATGGTLTLLSTPTVSAFVINNSATINYVSGPVTVQRAIDNSVNGGVGYRHYSSPVNGNTVNDLATSTFTPNFNTAYNESSFAPGTRQFPTVFLYDQARVVTDNGYNPSNGYSNFDRGWVVPASGASMLVGRGYTVNLGGSELVDFVGTLNNGSSSVTVSRNAAGTPASDLAGYQFLGNPYPAPIDWSRTAAVTARTAADIADGMYVYTSTSQYGGYYRAYAGGSGNPVIPMGQGFLVRKANPGSATFTFTNDFRLTTSDGTTFQRSAANVRPELEMALHSSDKMVQDMLNVYFEGNSTAGVDDKYDAFKLPNKNGMFLGTLTADGQELAIDGRPMPAGKLTIPLHVAVSASGSYTIETTKLANMNGMHAYLHDMRLGSYVDLALQSEYTFNLSTTNPTPRFELVFSPQPIDSPASSALAQQVSVYPSPAKGAAYIELPTSLGNENVVATLVDGMGRTVQTTTLPAEGEATHQMTLDGLHSGIYVLRLHTSAGVVAKRLVIE